MKRFAFLLALACGVASAQLTYGPVTQVDGLRYLNSDDTSLILDYDLTKSAGGNYALRGPQATFTRASSAYYVDSTGAYASAGTDVRRVTYDPTTLLVQGSMFEPARTNIALWSRDLTNAAWTLANGTAALTQTGIDGAANSASLFVATSANGTALQSITSGSAARISSVFLKRVSGSGSVQVTQDNGTTWTTVTLTGTDTSNGYTRASIAVQTTTNPIVGIRLVTSGDSVAVDFFQHEVARSISSPILTTTVAVTRAADVMTVATSEIPGYTDAAMTLYADFINSVNDGTNARTALCVHDGTSTERNRIAGVTSGELSGFTIDGGVTQADVRTAVAVAGTRYKLSYAATANSFNVVSNGTVGGSDAAGTMPTATTVSVGTQQASGGEFNGAIREVRLYNQAKSTAAMQDLTR